MVGWPEAPRPVSAHDLLPERALNGDGHARRALARELYDPLRQAGGGLLETLVVFLDQGLSVEAAARTLFVHANTVRYRLRRVHEITGYSPTDPRDAYALRLALTLGRLLGRRATDRRTATPTEATRHPERIRVRRVFRHSTASTVHHAGPGAAFSVTRRHPQPRTPPRRCVFRQMTEFANPRAGRRLETAGPPESANPGGQPYEAPARDAGH